MAILTQAELDKIEERANSVKDGPWEVCGWDSPIYQVVHNLQIKDGILSADWLCECDCQDDDEDERNYKMANFIANARADIPALLTTVREQERIIGELKAVIEEFDDLIDQSEGVYGLHLNGDGADWNWLMNNQWLEKYSEMEAAK